MCHRAGTSLCIVLRILPHITNLEGNTIFNYIHPEVAFEELCETCSKYIACDNSSTKGSRSNGRLKSQPERVLNWLNVLIKCKNVLLGIPCTINESIIPVAPKKWHLAMKNAEFYVEFRVHYATLCSPPQPK